MYFSQIVKFNSFGSLRENYILYFPAEILKKDLNDSEFLEMHFVQVFEKLKIKILQL